MEDKKESKAEKVLSLAEILEELHILANDANEGRPFDENRLDYLIELQNSNEEYKAEIAKEFMNWKNELSSFFSDCLEITRSYVPADIFSSDVSSLIALGLTEDIAKRIMKNRCLWLTRMSSTDIAKLHEVDLMSRFVVNVGSLDLIELSAIFASLPDIFSSDEQGKKSTWKDNIVSALKRRLYEREHDIIAKGQLRASCYFGLATELSQATYEQSTRYVYQRLHSLPLPSAEFGFGPIADRVSLYQIAVISSPKAHTQRRSFTEVCQTHGILGRARCASVHY